MRSGRRMGRFSERRNSGKDGSTRIIFSVAKERNSRNSAVSASETPPTERGWVDRSIFFCVACLSWPSQQLFFDATVFLDVPEPVLEDRLRARWTGYRLTPEGIRARLEDNDLPNARLVIRSSVPADVVVRNFG